MIVERINGNTFGPDDIGGLVDKLKFCKESGRSRRYGREGTRWSRCSLEEEVSTIFTEVVEGFKKK